MGNSLFENKKIFSESSLPLKNRLYQMKKMCLFVFLITFLASCATVQTKEDVIDRVWKGAGGRKVWEESRFLSFDFAPQREGKTLANRSHLWDRYTGDYRFETKTPENKNLLILFNINTQKGNSFLDGKVLPDSTNIKEIKKAYAYFINDSYWLFAPLKLEDKGVNVTLKDSEIIDGKEHDVLHLTFGKVGLTPGDQYWLYIDRDNGQVNRWKFLLEGEKEPGIFNWTNYKDLGGGLKLSTRKEEINQKIAITFPVASVLISVDRQKFTKR